MVPLFQRQESSAETRQTDKQRNFIPRRADGLTRGSTHAGGTYTRQTE